MPREGILLRILRRSLLLLPLLIAALPVNSASPAGEPLPEINFALDLFPRPCALDTDDPYERRVYDISGFGAPGYERYPGDCTRLRFAYGPIVVKPGQNDVLVGPITTEKPLRDGYVTRFKPNLVTPDGKVPPVEHVHLHHGTWLAEPNYGTGPFAAAGEEKTIFPFPKGYGMPIKATDQWQLLYMVHSAITKPITVYITYDIDFVPQANAQRLGLKPAYPIWLDVRPSGYPVFNAQRGFGDRGTCTWPKEECARFDPWGKRIVGQGKEGNGKGTDYLFPKQGEPLGRIDHFTGGTLIGIGGHLHPGGLQNEIDLIRPGRSAGKWSDAPAKRRAAAAKRRGTCARSRRGHRTRARKATAAATATRRGALRSRWGCKRIRRDKRGVTNPGNSVRIYTGEAWYWDWDDPSKPGGPPTSWDMSMRVNGLPRWGVHVEPGDILRNNATYDTKIQSSYENMGIAVALITPDNPDGTPNAPGVDPFSVPRDTSAECKSGGLEARTPTLCDKGIVSHGHYAENSNHSGPSGTWSGRPGWATQNVNIFDFLFFPGDLSLLSMGVPQVKLGSRLNFFNLDGLAIYHTVTSCKFPCLGRTSSSFPLANGQTSKGREVDFDSSELGIGTPYIGPAKQRLDWQLPVTQNAGFEPGEVVTYFCRIHPSMRGAFEVVK